MQQRDDDNETRHEIFLKDLQHLLGLEISFVAPSRKQKLLYEQKFFDISNEKYQHLRKVLLQNGKEAAAWILNYFMPHLDVAVSSLDYFREILSQWHLDPCSLTKEKSANHFGGEMMNLLVSNTWLLRNYPHGLQKVATMPTALWF